jgi:hypothetical protein
LLTHSSNQDISTTLKTLYLIGEGLNRIFQFGDFVIAVKPGKIGCVIEIREPVTNSFPDQFPGYYAIDLYTLQPVKKPESSMFSHLNPPGELKRQ